ncbi:MAG TPA: hypothetical protein VMI54_08540 [Polyangiaceae bacterium]|nr:hypothetical protein [Polyangiaceae bacterium]
MRGALAWSAASLLVAACVLPKFDVDPSLAPATGGTGGSGEPSTGGTGVTSGTGGGTAAQGGTSSNVAGQAGSGDDPRELACADYCQTYLQNCKDSPANTYTGIDDCLDSCFNLGWPFGTDLTQVNSVQCRDLHAHLAKDLPDPHCFHSAKVPTGTSCAPPPS